MEQISFFAITLSVTSLIFSSLAWILNARCKRISQWPIVWASALMAPMFCATLATAFLTLPELHPQQAVGIPNVQVTLDPIQVLRLSPLQNIESDKNVLDAIVWLYLIGVLTSLIRVIIGRARALRIARLGTKTRSSSGINYVVSSDEITPFILSNLVGDGYQIVIPNTLERELSSDELEHILSHELAHHYFADDRMGMLLRFAAAFSWFNPISHLTFVKWEHCIELRSDLTALHNQSKASRSAYANTLVTALHLTANRVRQYPAASFSTNHLRNEKMRIKSILHSDATTFKGFSSKLMIVSGATLISIAVASLATAKDNERRLANSNLIGEDMQLIMSGRLTASYGKSPDPFKKGHSRDHKGVDLGAPLGTPIYSPTDGVVLAATDLYRNKPKYGKVVVIKTSGKTKTLFAHLDSYKVKKGDKISAGTLLATVGQSGVSTGPHLHIETFVNGKRVNPLDVWQLAE